MFGWWGGAVVRLRWWVLAATAVVVLVGGLWGIGVFGALGAGGFDDPNSESTVASAKINTEFGQQADDLVVLYTSTTSYVDDDEMAKPVAAALGRLTGRPEVAQVQSYYNTGSQVLVSRDGHETIARIRLSDSGNKQAELKAITPLLTPDARDIQTAIGGAVAFQTDANKQIEKDIVQAEVLSLPILLVLLVFIFRGVVAATMPLVVGVVATLGAFTITRLLTAVTDISVFAANVITLIGLGLAVDYSLFVVSRFREELATGHDTTQAMQRTVATAGRTVVVSGLTVALALSSMLLFPIGFLKSMAYGGMAAVLVAMLAALTALPAVISVLGRRINSGRIPWPRRGDSAAGTGWARLARSVMRRPVLYVIVVSALLLSFAAPFLSAAFGGFDERVLPEGTPSRTVAEHVQANFPGGNVVPIYALVEGGGASTAQAFAREAATVPNVSGAQVAMTKGPASIVLVNYLGQSTTSQARDIVTALRALPAPAGARVSVTGRSAFDLDALSAIGRGLPWMALYVAVVTFVLLFLAFGSVVLPIKAIVMNVISIGASFGVVIWVFQDGHLSGLLGFTPTGFIEPTNLILMLAILFGLSTDYEVFLLSRVREEWDAGRDNTEAVSAGLQRTGGIITAAAVLLIVVIGGFATGGSETIKLLGVGTLVAVAVDAGLVRTLLVPATMRLLGRWNWWAPGPLARLYRRYGRHDAAPPAPAPELEHAGAT
jgi:RND superfamily putative drug exporter